MNQQPPDTFTYTKWRHGGWYVQEVQYPGGAIGCVTNNFEDKKWRIACDPRPFEEQPTFKNRDAAARAEFELAQQAHLEAAQASTNDAQAGNEAVAGSFAIAPVLF